MIFQDDPSDEKSKKKKPLQERSRKTVEDILGAAVRIIRKDGFNAFNTNKIAEIAGVSIGSVYQFFKNKDSILEELMKRVLDERLDRVIKTTSEKAKVGDDLKGVIRVGIETVFDNINQNESITALLIEQAPRLFGFKRLQNIEQMLMPLIIAKLDENKINIRPQNRELAVYFTIQIVRIIAIVSFLDKGKRFDKNEVITELTELLYRYLNPDQD